MKKRITLKKMSRFTEKDILKEYIKMFLDFLHEQALFGMDYEDYVLPPESINPSDIFEDASTFTHRYMMLIDDEPAGLLTIGVGENCHPDADFFVQDFYVAPEFRRKGNGTRMMNIFIKDHPGTYCMVIINGDVPAEEFWKQYIKYGSGILNAEDVGWQTKPYLSVYAFRAFDYLPPHARDFSRELGGTG